MVGPSKDSSLDPSAAPGEYQTIIRGVYLDSAGEAQQFTYQSTEAAQYFLRDREVLFKGVARTYAERGGELLSLQLVVERRERLDVDALLGRPNTAPAEGAKVVQLFGPENG